MKIVGIDIMKLNNRCHCYFKFPELLSEYRQELMGIGIIGVFSIHLSVFLTEDIIPMLLLSLTKFFPKLVYTHGFLLLSGFGLYFSMAKDNDIKSFYFRRFKKLMIPFLTISIIPIIILEQDSFHVIKIVELLSTLYFWIDGNYCGLWYISLMVVLYIIYPLYFFLTKQRCSVAIIFIILSFLCIYVFKSLNPAYYNLTEIALSKIPCFFIGSWLAVCRNKKQYFAPPIMIACFFICSKFCVHINQVCADIYSISLRCINIVFLCYIFEYFRSYSFFSYLSKFLRFFGQYSLELYLIHCFLYFVLLKIFNNTLTFEIVWAELISVFSVIIFDIIKKSKYENISNRR